MATRNVKDAPYSAAGNGVADDRTAIQDAIDDASADGGGIVLFPVGTYRVTQDGSNAWCLNLPANVTLSGEGMGATTIIQAASIATSVRCIRVSGDFARVHDMTLNGNKASQTANEHRHGIIVDNADFFKAERVRFLNFTGDGYYVYNSDHPVFFECLSTGNDRNGMTIGASTNGTTILAGHYYSNAVQQIDSEPTGSDVVQNIRIGFTYVDVGASNDYAITMSGVNMTNRGHGWSLIGNTINGAVRQVWCDNATIVGNHGRNPTDKSSIELYRLGYRYCVVGNALEHTQNITDEVSTILVLGTDNGGQYDAPNNAIVVGNAVKATRPYSYGIRAHAVKDVIMVANSLEGAGSASAFSAAIIVRPTITYDHMRCSLIMGNYCENWGAYGLLYSGNSTARQLASVVIGNVFDDSTGTQTKGARLDEDTPLKAIDKLCYIGNMATGGCVTEIEQYNTTTPVLTAGSEGLGAQYGYPTK